MIRFYGCKTSLEDWAKLVKSTVGKTCSDIKMTKGRVPRAYMEVDLTDEDREAMMVHWYERAPENNEYNYPWNYRITFEVRK